ncbi:MAG: diaminohydroxyphosphoribosylaminopyrimidine deaminase [Bacteroidia bacterium]|jgi:diaminohydroxyphosphoribosylaminopyrimidine deaminase/5-amino-6-(5-phosphoribosylamino)uracil reductase
MSSQSLVSAVDDAYWMAEAIALAARGRYSTSPNPQVGCVLVKEGRLLGQGWHQRAGGGHAEVHALADCVDARGATAYVSLEPCSHHGKTPPCAESLIKAGVARVVIAMQDPNPLVAGRGISLLKEAGIAVDVGLQQADAEALNLGFIKRMKCGLPRVRAKLAMSVDGRTAMASGASQWITGPAARADVQRLRAASCAIVSGVETVITDNAALTVRLEEAAIDAANCRQPLRVIVDSRLRTPASAALFQSGGKILMVTAHKDLERRAALEAAGAEVLLLAGADGRVDLPALLKELGRRQCNEVMVEAGATLCGAFMQAGLLDALTVYMAPTLLGSNARALMDLPLNDMNEQRKLNIEAIRAVGDDWRMDINVAAVAG